MKPLIVKLDFMDFCLLLKSQEIWTIIWIILIQIHKKYLKMLKFTKVLLMESLSIIDSNSKEKDSSVWTKTAIFQMESSSGMKLLDLLKEKSDLIIFLSFYINF